jgi:uncharacterized protein YndB with AHSA1/START domain
MLIKILMALAVIVVVFVAIVAVQPSEFRVARTATISAPAPVVFAQVNDFHKWPAWSPYDKLDPAMKKTYEGPPAGTGASYSWIGNGQAGEGHATITESRPNDLVRIKLDFVKPFEGTAFAEFAFKPEGDRTIVEWSLAGKNNFVSKAVHLFMNMDKMVGGQFEEGLAQMKSVVEAAPKG